MAKKIINIIIIILLIAIAILTFYKINKNHENKLYYVLDSEIKYASNKCYIEKKCDKFITLQELYDKNYLDTKYNPITKEELNKDLKITIHSKKIEIENYK